MPSVIDTCGQKRAGPPTRSSGTWAKKPVPTPHEAMATATRDQANQPAARGLIGSPVGAIVSPEGDAGNGSLPPAGLQLSVRWTLGAAQTTGAGACRAEGAATPRQKVNASANDARSWPNMKTRKKIPGSRLPTATNESWFATE